MLGLSTIMSTSLGAVANRARRMSEECRTAGDVNIPVAILCSSDSDDEQDLSSMTTKTSRTGADLRIPAATLCSSDGSKEEDDGEDSEELDSADTGPSGSV